jgi:hypothetical protein
VRVEAFTIRLRARQRYEGTDLGVRLCQAAAGSVFSCYWSVAVPLFALCAIVLRASPGWALFAIWFAKPWLDRTILFALARAAFGNRTTLRDLWQARGAVWGGQILTTLIHQRLSLRRAFTQPVYQLEGLRGGARRKRLAVLSKRKVGAARAVTTAYSLVESALTLALIGLAYWLAPQGETVSPFSILQGGPGGGPLPYLLLGGYALSVCVLEPFYVAAGFGLYLSRRVDLEAWDIEQEFRAVFAR